MKIRDGIILRDVLGQAVLLDNSGKLHDVIKLNNTSEFIWKAIEQGNSLEQIANSVASEFDVNFEKALQDAKEMIDWLSGKGILQ